MYGLQRLFYHLSDSAIPGLVNSVGEVFETNIKRIESKGAPGEVSLRKGCANHREEAARSGETAEDAILDTRPLLLRAIGDTIDEYELAAGEKPQLAQEFDWFMDAMGEFKFNLVAPYYQNREKKARAAVDFFHHHQPLYL